MRTTYTFPSSSSARQFWLRMDSKGIKAFQLNESVSVWPNEQDKTLIKRFAESLRGIVL